MARRVVNHVVHQHLLASRFPGGIFGINVAGGGFTTFSSFSFDTLALAA